MVTRKVRCVACGKELEVFVSYSTYIPSNWYHIEQNAPPVAWADYFCSIKCVMKYLVGRKIINILRKAIGLYREYGDAQL